MDSFLAGDYGSALLKFDEILSKGFNALHFCAALSSHFRDLMVTRNGGLDSLLELPDSLRKRYSEQSSRCSLKFLYDALAITTACEAGYKQAINPRLHIEFALMRLAFLSKASAGVSEPVPAKSEPAPAPVPVAARPEAASAKPAASPESAASPAPAAPAPRERKRPAKTGSALSLTSILEEEQAAKSTAKAPAVADELPEDEKLQQAWNEIPAEYASSPRLANTLKNALLDIHTEDGIKVLTFKVSNASQEKWIRENRLLSLEGILQRKTGSSRIRLEVGVIPAEEKEAQPYTDHEKATALMGQNGEIQNLVKDFGLETK